MRRTSRSSLAESSATGFCGLTTTASSAARAAAAEQTRTSGGEQPELRRPHRQNVNAACRAAALNGDPPATRARDASSLRATRLHGSTRTPAVCLVTSCRPGPVVRIPLVAVDTVEAVVGLPAACRPRRLRVEAGARPLEAGRCVAVHHGERLRKQLQPWPLEHNEAAPDSLVEGSHSTSFRGRGDGVEDGSTAELQVRERARAEPHPEVDGLRPVLVLNRRDARGVRGTTVDEARSVLEAERTHGRGARDAHAYLVHRQEAAVLVLPAVDLGPEGGRLQPGAVVVGLVPEAEHRVHAPHGHRERVPR